MHALNSYATPVQVLVEDIRRGPNDHFVGQSLNNWPRKHTVGYLWLWFVVHLPWICNSIVAAITICWTCDVISQEGARSSRSFGNCPNHHPLTCRHWLKVMFGKFAKLDFFRSITLLTLLTKSWIWPNHFWNKRLSPSRKNFLFVAIPFLLSSLLFSLFRMAFCFAPLDQPLSELLPFLITVRKNFQNKLKEPNSNMNSHFLPERVFSRRQMLTFFRRHVCEVLLSSVSWKAKKWTVAAANSTLDSMINTVIQWQRTKFVLPKVSIKPGSTETRSSLRRTECRTKKSPSFVVMESNQVKTSMIFERETVAGWRRLSILHDSAYKISKHLGQGDSDWLDSLWQTTKRKKNEVWRQPLVNTNELSSVVWRSMK